MLAHRRSLLAIVMIVCGLAGAGWAWWPIARRQGTAAIAPPVPGAPSLDVSWDVPETMRRGERTTLVLRLVRTQAPEDPAAGPAHLRLVLETTGMQVVPAAPFEITLKPGESVSARWEVAAAARAEARWRIEWQMDAESRPVWLHPESWAVRSCMGLSSYAVRAASLMLMMIGTITLWMGRRR